MSYVIPLRFCVYKHNLVIKDNVIITRNFIVLKYNDGTIQFTNFHKYVNSSTNHIKKVTSSDNSRFQFIIQLLNYAFFVEGITKLDDITIPIVDSFLNRYGMCELPTDDELTQRSEDTVKRCVRYVMDFLDALIEDSHCKCKISKKSLYKTVERRNKRGNVYTEKVPIFNVRYIGSKRPIFRDIPNKTFDMLFHHIVQHHKDILGLVMLSAFGGLRPSEACNVRRTDSPLGAGILFDIVDGRLFRIEIDIRQELNLRSDLISVGGIKKERKQAVPDIFLNVFKETYDIYMNYLNEKKYEQQYGAFSLNKQGRAMTYATYYQKFQDIIKNEMIPIFLKSDDPEVVIYGRMLMEHNLAPHVFRHWYTVQLVLSGINDVGTLMYYRGDKSPESSLVYLQNKSELEKQYRKVNNEVFDYLLWASKRIK